MGVGPTVTFKFNRPLVRLTAIAWVQATVLIKCSASVKCQCQCQVERICLSTQSETPGPRRDEVSVPWVLRLLAVARYSQLPCFCSATYRICTCPNSSSSCLTIPENTARRAVISAVAGGEACCHSRSSRCHAVDFGTKTVSWWRRSCLRTSRVSARSVAQDRVLLLVVSRLAWIFPALPSLPP